MLTNAVAGTNPHGHVPPLSTPVSEAPPTGARVAPWRLHLLSKTTEKTGNNCFDEQGEKQTKRKRKKMESSKNKPNRKNGFDFFSGEAKTLL